MYLYIFTFYRIEIKEVERREEKERIRIKVNCPIRFAAGIPEYAPHSLWHTSGKTVTYIYFSYI